MEAESWKKSVTVSPVSLVFKHNNEEGKGISQIDINNRSAEHVIFKVKTTEPNNYTVRPNQGVMLPGQSVTVKIICQANIA